MTAPPTPGVGGELGLLLQLARREQATFGFVADPGKSSTLSIEVERVGGGGDNPAEWAFEKCRRRCRRYR
jgi:hypothetical protein